MSKYLNLHAGYVCLPTTFFIFFSIYILCWEWLNIFYLAAVLLKQFIKQHWQEDEESFIQPVVSIEEKVISIFSSHLFLDLGYYLVDSYLLGNKHPLKSDTFMNINEFCTVLEMSSPVNSSSLSYNVVAYHIGIFFFF